MIRKRGRPRKINMDLLINCFRKYKSDIVINNQICSKDSKVWDTISKEMSGTITSFSLYSYACNNIYDIKDLLLNKELNDRVDSTLESSANSLESSKNSSNNLVTDDEIDNFEVSVSKLEFDSIIECRLHKRTGRNLNKKVIYRRNLRFRVGVYQDFLAKLFWKTRRLQSCAMNYINHYIPQNIDGGYLNGKYI